MLHERQHGGMAGQKLLLLIMFGWAVFLVPTLTPSWKKSMSIKQNWWPNPSILLASSAISAISAVQHKPHCLHTYMHSA